MKWLFVFAVCVYCWVGYVQHTYNREGIKETTQELLMESFDSSVGISGINLPLSYTFLAQEVEATVFITIDGEVDRTTITVSPVEAIPLVSVFMPPRKTIIAHDPLLVFLRNLKKDL